MILYAVKVEPMLQRLPEVSSVRTLTRGSLAAVDADSGQRCIVRSAAPAIAASHRVESVIKSSSGWSHSITYRGLGT